MNYKNYSRVQLIEKIEEQEILIKEILREKEQEVKLEYAWTGNLGKWYWNIKTNTVRFNPLKITTLGYDEKEIPEHVTYQFFTDKLHSDDYDKTMNAMLDHLQGRKQIYEVEYRILAKDGNYKWYYDRGKITQFDELGKPLFLAGIVFDITEKKQIQIDLENKNKMLMKLSMIDGLTKISNHRSVIEKLQFEIMESNRTKSPLSIAMFDIDNFKYINDTFGHIYGDKVLVEVSSIIENNIRETDTAGRYGGEEFMVVFNNADKIVAYNIAERIRRSIENHFINSKSQVTISCGVKEYTNQEVTILIEEADKCLYEAKKLGKNKVVAK